MCKTQKQCRNVQNVRKNVKMELYECLLKILHGDNVGIAVFFHNAWNISIQLFERAWKHNGVTTIFSPHI